MPPEDKDQEKATDYQSDETSNLVLRAQLAGVQDIDEVNILERLSFLHTAGLLSEDGEEVYWDTKKMVNPYD